MVKIKVKASERYSDDFVREIEESIRDVVEGRVEDFEKLMEKYGAKPKKVRA